MNRTPIQPPVPERGTDVDMMRGTLADIPRIDLPKGYSVRFYASGDEEMWTRIWMTADIFSTITPQTFDREFGPHRDALPERMVFLCDAQGEAVGTATAWLPNAEIDAAAGLVHWVALLPRVQGQHLAKPMMAVVLQRLKELGYDRAALRTQEARLVAVNLYLELGFVPLVRSDEDRAAWRRVRSQLRGSLLDGMDLSG